ncbi:PD-(D/E)XK nuclease family protein, partial [bacterium]|nr:PD-(D/E)XK nuclease family protein [bacterium]
FTLDELHAWLSARGAAATPPDAAWAKIACAGRLDRVDLGADGTSVHVIDYKTGEIPSPKKVAAGEDLQLAVYALAVRLGKVAGAPENAVLTGTYYGLKSGGVGFDPARPHLKPDHDLVRDGAAVLATALAMADRAHDYALVPPDLDPDGAAAPCRHCPWRGVCRIDELVSASCGEATP